MNYSETIQYLFTSAPLFQQVGGAAYKEGLSTTHTLDAHFGYPHKLYRTIHVAGTNGKGSCAHTLAAMLQHHGLRVGLYTSPHLIDFRERIRVNGEMIPEQAVIDFVEEHRAFFEPLYPSFFELTTALAFRYFADEKIDVAVIEVGLGGRLDCTNIITPELCVVTNISFDHTQFLGNTLASIATEKAGIFKLGIPAVVGETCAETRPVFEEKAHEIGAPIIFAEDDPQVLRTWISEYGYRHYETKNFGELTGELIGECQAKNTNTLLTAANILEHKFNLSEADIRYGFQHVCEATGLMGRWQQIATEPQIVCDTGHNIGGWQYLAQQLNNICKHVPHLHIVFGMASDKDVEGVMSMLPKQATYFWARASVHRAMNEDVLVELGEKHGLFGRAYSSVAEAYEAAQRNAEKDDFIYVGGSSFVVADLLTSLQGKY